MTVVRALRIAQGLAREVELCGGVLRNLRIALGGGLVFKRIEAMRDRDSIGLGTVRRMVAAVTGANARS